MKRDEQAAAEAVKKAAVFFRADDESFSTGQVTELLGYVRGGRIINELNELRANALSMIGHSKRFTPSTRATRSDCYRPDAQQCVWNFCHSEEGSRVDTNSYFVYETKHPKTDEKTKCAQRIWNEVTLDQRY